MRKGFKEQNVRIEKEKTKGLGYNRKGEARPWRTLKLCYWLLLECNGSQNRDFISSVKWAEQQAERNEFGLRFLYRDESR